MATPAARLRTDVALPEQRGGSVGLRRVLGSDYRLGFIFVAPMVVLVLALVAYPFCYAIYLSMTQKFVGMPPVFVGFENYIRLASDGFFQRAVVNSFVFTFTLGGGQAAARHAHGAGADVPDPLPEPLHRPAPHPLGGPHRRVRPQFPLDLRRQPRRPQLSAGQGIPDPAAGRGLAQRAGNGHGLGHLRQHLARLPLLRHLVPGRHEEHPGRDVRGGRGGRGQRASSASAT